MVCDADNPLLALELNRSAYRMLRCLGGRVVLEAERPGLVVVGEILGFTGVWFCYGILRFVVFLDKCTKHFSLGVLPLRGFRFRYNV